MTGAGFVVNATGVATPVVEAREVPRREEPRPVTNNPIREGDWVRPLPGSGRDFPTARVERAEFCAGLDDDQVVMVLPPGGMPELVKASEVYRVMSPV